MVFDWSKPDSILEKVKKEIYSKETSKKLKRADFLFDLTAVLLLALHIFMAFYGVYYEILPQWMLVIFFYASRTGLAAVGHYHNHRKKDGIIDWGDPLFDM
jgi:fatty acid desaturase